MHRRRRPGLPFGYLVVLSLLAVSLVGSVDPRGEPRRLHPGDLVSIRGVTLVVPANGETVWADVHLAIGGDLTVGVESRSDGRVVIHPNRPVIGAELVSTTSTNPCLDGAYTLNGHRWATTYNWYFKSSTTPSNLSVSGAEGALTKAVSNITTAHDSCGLADNVSATASYKGRTSTSLNISNSATCLAGDGKSVVGFGTLPSGYLGMTCWRTNSYNQATEADMRLNKYSYRWVVSIPSSCSNKWVVEAAATHEFGHVFGLGHVSETYHPKLTMSTVIRACQRSEATLGLGDVRGLEALY